MNKSGHQLPTAQNSSDLKKKDKRNTTCLERHMPNMWYVKTGVQCGYCQRWFHFEYENTTEEQVLKEYSAEQQYICTQDQHQTFTFSVSEVEEIKELKEKHEHAKGKQIEMKMIYDELKVKYQKNQKTHNSYIDWTWQNKPKKKSSNHYEINLNQNRDCPR